MRFLVSHLLETAATEFGDRTAVIDGDRSLSYSELNVASNRLAHLLVAQGVVKGDRVGLYLDKSLESVIAVYGVLKAGAAYVPFDPDAPPSRLAYIATNCQIRCLVTGFEKRSNWPTLLDEGAPLETLVIVNGKVEAGLQRITVLGREDLGRMPDNPPHTEAIDQDLAYILYTSGSTGVPKGVMLTHRNALAFISWAAEEFGITSIDRLSSHAPLHFDLSVFDLYAAAYAGAAVVLVPPKLSMFPNLIVRFIRENEVTVWYSVPSILSMVTLRGGLAETPLSSLRTVLFAGEVFPTKYLRQLMGFLPDARFANLYGPTETNVCTWYEVSSLSGDSDEAVPIGKAISNNEVWAMNDNGEVAQLGDKGELVVRGATVMRGYWGEPEKTAKVLVPDSSEGSLGDPVYLTGDQVEVLANGDFRYIGRRDAQVKTRGYRVELGDVEAAIYAHPAVIECAVVAIADELVTNRLIAHVIVKGDCTEGDLAQSCGERLPRYMVPEFILVSELPKTSTGKVDRQALVAGAAD